MTTSPGDVVVPTPAAVFADSNAPEMLLLVLSRIETGALGGAVSCSAVFSPTTRRMPFSGELGAVRIRSCSLACAIDGDETNCRSSRKSSHTLM